MSSHHFAIVLTIVLSAIGVLGDYFLKLASNTGRPFWSGWFLAGFVVYSSTAIGWVHVMSHLKLSTIGTVYCVSTVLLLTALGFAMGERLLMAELVGVILAISSLCLLARFS